jgi:hypothetical protein
MLVSYNDYIICDMSSYFSEEPGDMICCPWCRCNLDKSEIRASQLVVASMSEPGLIPWHDFSNMFKCSTCCWWYVRERWGLGEIYHIYDHVVIGVAKRWKMLASRRAYDIKNYIEQKRRALSLRILDVETVKHIIEEYSTSNQKVGEVHHIGSVGSVGAGSDIYLIEGDITILVLIKPKFNEKTIRVVEKIDILNGVLHSNGQPTEMIVSIIKKKSLKAYRVRLLGDKVGLKLLEKTMVEQGDPWSDATTNERLYIKSQILPDVYGILFPGGKKK